MKPTKSEVPPKVSLPTGKMPGWGDRHRAKLTTKAPSSKKK